MDYQIVRLIDKPEMKEQAALWFHKKWGIPLEAYMDSMEQCLKNINSVPQWYLAMEGDRIICGLGVIENDFHDRKDLTPNICAVYTEEDKRIFIKYRCSKFGLFNEREICCHAI